MCRLEPSNSSRSLYSMRRALAALLSIGRHIFISVSSTALRISCARRIKPSTEGEPEEASKRSSRKCGEGGPASCKEAAVEEGIGRGGQKQPQARRGAAQPARQSNAPPGQGRSPRGQCGRKSCTFHAASGGAAADRAAAVAMHVARV